MTITSMNDLEEAALRYGILPFFRNNIKGFSVSEMTPPDLLFGGNEYEGCWEWKGPVIRNRNTAYGKFFRRKAGFISVELLPYFIKFRRNLYPVKEDSTDEMIYDIICFNDKMTSSELREILIGGPKKRTACDLRDIDSENITLIQRPSRHSMEGPLQRLQMGGRLCISDFKYKTTRNGERFGWGVAEYSAPEMLFERTDVNIDLSPADCLEYMIDYVGSRYSRSDSKKLKALLS